MLSADTSAEQSYELPGCAEWAAEMAERGVLVATMGLHPPASASTVRVRGDEVLLTDGPFAETKEQMGGVTLIECADRAEAVRVASCHPWAAVGMIEVRQVLGQPLQEGPLPADDLLRRGAEVEPLDAVQLGEGLPAS